MAEIYHRNFHKLILARCIFLSRMLDCVLEDKYLLLSSEELDINLQSVSPSREKAKCNYYVNEAFDYTSEFHCRLHIDIRETLNRAHGGKAMHVVCMPEYNTDRSINKISGHNVTDRHLYETELPNSSCLPNVFYSNPSTKGTNIKKKKEKASKVESRNYTSHSDPIRAFYSAIYIESNLNLPHFGNV